MKTSGSTSSGDACRDELIVWLDAHAQWPLTVRLETSSGDLVAEMAGRLTAGTVAGVYAVDADGGSLQFTIPLHVSGVRIDGSRSVIFRRVDLPIVVTIAVVNLAHQVA